MDEGKEVLSYARLVNRHKYYMEKSLKLEKDFIFVNEKLHQLEEKLKESQIESEKVSSLNHDLQNKYQTLLNSYNTLKEQYAKDHDEQMKRIDELQKNQKTEDDRQQEDLYHRIEGYEALLAEVQEEMNAKEKEIDIYKRRMAILEKRLKANGDRIIKERPQEITSTPKQSKVRAMVYTDYAIIFGEKKTIIRGDLIIENIGLESLSNPIICFRFYPGDAALLKGHISDANDIDVNGLDQEDEVRWVFLENEWSEEARERGEIWIHPLKPLSLASNETLKVSDFQIPIENEYNDHVSIECFVFFQDNHYKVKSANQILINV
ncbi:hypothetical protein GMB86_01000 [Terrilactibacillus sp. BCM23-1]|uniref:Uncharacterized protein n=1 Tax=Terrilactibacillus tamarindi TaxID=2599694 RepID=A0A6N8CL58_9BACI|nr:hypothetical protein [Terrilactibacillus tamarindi]MTT30592.1 hypothetical protein [Terrilactibacillus tamarindi]